MENEKNKTYYKPQYKCGICNTIHDSIAERVKCETACLKKQEEEEKKAAAAKKAEEKTKKYNEIVELANKYEALVKAYVRDYGSIELVSRNDHIPYLSKFLGWF